jgi:DNA-binding CsgD family transcriptional regulator
MLYSLGHDRKAIADMLGLRLPIVVTHIRQIAPCILLNSEEVNLGMAADYLVRRAKITETQIEIFYWASRNMGVSAIVERLGISRQAVWKARKEMSNNLLFSPFPSDTVE